jgi:hypothetical protein
MGIGKDYRKRIKSHQQAIAVHEAKIRKEEDKPFLRFELIDLWRKHILNSQNQIEKLERRLLKRRE